MPRTDPELLGDGLKSRLRAELDRVHPRYTTPRYLAPRHRVAVWRIAPAALVAAVVGMLGLSAYAATGSANPVVWTQQIMTRIEPDAAPESTTATPSPTPSHHAPAVPVPPTHQAEPAERPEPSEEPQATPTPEHDGGDGGGDDHHSSQSSASPSPYGGDH